MWADKHIEKLLQGETVTFNLIKGVQDHRVLIGNNHGKINGWTGKNKIYGILVHPSYSDLGSV